MTRVNSTKPSRVRKPVKPSKPHKDFPLTAHPSKRWCKKVKGQMCYFGSWVDDREGERALELWLEQKDALLAGQKQKDVTANAKSGLPTLADLVNKFLTTKKRLVEDGERSIHTFNAYHDVCKWLTETFGRNRLLTDIRTDDFERLRNAWSERWNAVRLANEINRARVVFNYAFKEGMIDRPMRFGEGFSRPSKKTIRLNRAEKGKRLFEADELRRILKAASQPMEAMILLGINVGLGNNDIAKLPVSAIDLERGWIDFPRPKTGVPRECPLWPETVAALAEWMEQRPAAKNEADAELVFLTVRGHAFDRGASDELAMFTDDSKSKGKYKAASNRTITHECRKLLDELGINGNRNFYALRHTTETIGGGAKDQPALNHIMGHDDGSMSSMYRERIEDKRLQAVAEHVRKWLFPKPAKRAGKAKK